MDEKRISRRRFVEGASASGVAGLVAGGALGATLSGDDGDTASAGSASKAPTNVGTPLPLTGPLAGDGDEARHASTCSSTTTRTPNALPCSSTPIARIARQIRPNASTSKQCFERAGWTVVRVPAAVALADIGASVWRH